MRLLTAGFLLCLLTSQAWASGMVKHPSDYGDTTPPGVMLSPCGVAVQTLADGVKADCFFDLTTGGAGIGDYLFTLFTPSASTSIDSVTFKLFAALDTNNTDGAYDLVEGSVTDPCSGINVGCLSSPSVAISGPAAPGIGDNTFGFTGFTGAFSGDVTVFFSNCDSSTTNCILPDEPVLESATISTTASTPEPSGLGFMAVALVSLMVLRRKFAARRD